MTRKPRPELPAGAASVLRLESLLGQAAGLDLRALDLKQVEWIVERRQRACGAPTPQAYEARLLADGDELEALLEELLVKETRFFRDAEVFRQMVDWVVARTGQQREPLRILSAPCATGEEPYSVAALLSAAGVRSEQYTVLGLDLSKTALAGAKRGVYGENSLRGVSEEQRALCVEDTPEGWRVPDRLRAQVLFEARNVAGEHGLEGLGLFDLILCRNLLIYLHPEARSRVARSLHGALAPGGRLVLGSADGVPEMRPFFASAGHPSAFAFESRPGKLEAATAPASTAAASTEPVSTASAAPAAAAATPPGSDVEAARALYARAARAYDSGEFDLAERACRQALYLDGAHPEALALWAKLWRGRAPDRMWQALKQRIQRSLGARAREQA